MQPQYISLDGLVVGILMPWWGGGGVSQKTQILPSSIQLNGYDIPRSTSVRNLGVTLDQTLSFQQHVFRICQACCLELRRISSVRHYLIHDAIKTHLRFRCVSY